MGDRSKVLNPTEFLFLQRLLRAEAGIVVGEDKGYLVDARLLSLARCENSAVSALIDAAQAGNARIRRALVEAMTTNETSFFRDPPVFEALVGTLIPHLKERIPDGPLRVWCAASSTGQEPYSLAIAVLTQHPELAARFRIHATDLDTQALSRACEGRYSQLEVSRGLTTAQRTRFFVQQGDEYRVADEVRAMVTFGTQNLVAPFEDIGEPHLVLIRNVLIYFDAETKAGILSRVSQVLHPEGLLVLGSTESTVGLTVPLERAVFGRCIAYGVTAASSGSSGRTKRPA